MSRLLSVIILFFIILSCSNELPIKGVMLSGTIKDTSVDTIYLKTHTRYYLDSQEKIEHSILIDSKKNFSKHFTLSKGYYELIIDDKSFSLFLKEGNNLNISIIDSDVSINGGGATENRYLQKRMELENQLAPINFYHYFSYLEESEFLKYADSIKILRDDLISNYNLPNNSFKFLEESYSKIDKAHKYIKYPWTREVNDSSYKPSEKYPYHFKNLNLNDERLVDIPLFNMLLFSDIQLQSSSTNTNSNSDASLSSLKTAIYDYDKVRNNLVKEKAVFTIANFLMERSDSLDVFFKTYKNFTKQEQYLDTIENKYHKLKRIAIGDYAPSFKFKNRNEDVQSLDDFIGNVIYIDVWATWCKPCIKEIEFSNKLQEELKKENIKFLNICIETDKSEWIKAINKYNFNGIHLFCSDQELSEFKKKYLIEALPRYLIINQYGKIVDFNAQKPSNSELKSKLLSVLNKI